MVNDSDKNIEVHIHEHLSPIRDRLVRVETRVDGHDEDLNEIKENVRDIKGLLTKHTSDEQGVWIMIRAELARTRGWVKGAGVTVVGVTMLIAALNHLGIIPV